MIFSSPVILVSRSKFNCPRSVHAKTRSVMVTATLFFFTPTYMDLRQQFSGVLIFTHSAVQQTKLDQKCAPILAEFRTGAPPFAHMHTYVGGCTSGEDRSAPWGADNASITAHRWIKIKCRQKPFRHTCIGNPVTTMINPCAAFIF